MNKSKNIAVKAIKKSKKSDVRLEFRNAHHLKKIEAAIKKRIGGLPANTTNKLKDKIMSSVIAEFVEDHADDICKYVDELSNHKILRK